MTENSKPALFGQAHSSRDYSRPDSWGKNRSNSSFPASLVAYMSLKDIKPVYICTSKKNKITHKHIDAKKLLCIDPLCDNAYYNYEAGYPPYEKFYQGEREKIDLVMIDRFSNEVKSGLEVKLTAVPDNTTNELDETRWGAEIVMRPPTINFLVCSICANYTTPAKKDRLRSILKQVPQINHWEEAEEVLPHFGKIEKAVLDVSADMCEHQKPLILQPTWKTEGKKMKLKEDCLDVFVWSNLSVIQLCTTTEGESIKKITRFNRTLIWIFKMLLDYVTYDTFDYKRIIRLLSYNLANDKAFAVPGTKSHAFLDCIELRKPRIGKHEIKNIILGGGQNLLSPERRFDAVLVNSPDLF